MKRIIGVTGGIASGKSYVCNVLKELGYPVVDSDEISKELSVKGMPVYQAIVETFGEEYLTEDGNIDRKKLGLLIFNNSAAKMVLDRATHPLIVEEIKQRISNIQESLIFLDIPLLFEAKLQYLCDKIVCVYLERTVQIERLMNRDNIDYNYALSKIKSQMSLEEKKRLSDYVISTEDGFEKTRERIIQLIEIIKGD